MTATLQGIFPAVWTPLREDGSLDRAALEINIAFLRRAGVHGLMTLGSTAEFIRFSCEQRREILEQIASHAHGLPILANISHMRLDRAIDLARHAKSCGAFAISALPPWFYQLEPADLAEFYVQLGQASELPLVLYNYPEVTGKRIEIETIRSILQRVPILGVKQSGADFEYHKELLALGREHDFVVMTGFDTRLADAVGLGATGCVSGLSNAIADLLVPLFNACVNGDKPNAQRLTEQMQELGGLISRLSFPLNVMAAIEARGLHTGGFKLPVAQETMKRYHALVTDLRAFYQRSHLSIPPVA